MWRMAKFQWLNPGIELAIEREVGSVVYPWLLTQTLIGLLDKAVMAQFVMKVEEWYPEIFSGEGPLPLRQTVVEYPQLVSYLTRN